MTTPRRKSDDDITAVSNPETIFRYSHRTASTSSDA